MNALIGIVLELLKKSNGKKIPALGVVVIAILSGMYVSDWKNEARAAQEVKRVKDLEQDQELVFLKKKLKKLPQMQRSLVRIERALHIPPEKNYYEEE